MILLGLDFETTGKEPETTEITEVGLVLWDTLDAQPVVISDHLVKPTQAIPLEIIELTGITQEYVDCFGSEPNWAIQEVMHMMGSAEAIVAHNGNVFDFPILKRYAELYKIPLPTIPYIDTMIDVPYPSWMTSRKLKHLAVDHGITPAYAHRATFDVLMMLQIINCYNVEEIIQQAASPIVTIQALVRFDQKELAKTAGFHWENDKGQKQWIKSVRWCVFEKESPTYPFQYVLVK
jgi:DNA polymerase III subunit epsilon